MGSLFDFAHYPKFGILCGEKDFAIATI